MENITNFNDFNISDELKRAIGDMEFTEPTPIQSQVIPYILDGKDVIAQAPTGTGKTCAFAIPIINNIDTDSKDVQALVLCPTRELAIQMTNEFKELLKYTESVRIASVYGGQNIDRQLANLRKKPQIICGTPGRVLDHIERRTIKLHNLKVLVLDEADEMLDMGFRPDMDKIYKTCPRDKQVVLFSATIPAPIKDISKNYQVEPVSIVTKGVELPPIEQVAIKCKEADKIGLMTDILDAYDYSLTIAFCNTKKRVDELTEILNSLGYNAEGLHGDLRQSKRDGVMKKYRTGQTRVLVATDVAARGIDVSGVQAIFNFDTPNDVDFYVHRIGRTARAKSDGIAYTFYTKGQADLIDSYERYTKVKMKKMDKFESSKDFSSKKLNNLFKGLDKPLDNTKKFILTELENYNAEHGTDYSPLELLAVALDGNASMIMTENTSRKTRETKARLKSIPSVRYFITIGTIDNTDEEKLKKFVMAKTGIPEQAIVEVKLLEKFGFVQVMEEFEDMMYVLNETTFNGRKITCEKAGEKSTGSKSKASSGAKSSKNSNAKSVNKDKSDRKSSTKPPLKGGKTSSNKEKNSKKSSSKNEKTGKFSQKNSKKH